MFWLAEVNWQWEQWQQFVKMVQRHCLVWILWIRRTWLFTRMLFSSGVGIMIGFMCGWIAVMHNYVYYFFCYCTAHLLMLWFLVLVYFLWCKPYCLKLSINQSFSYYFVMRVFRLRNDLYCVEWGVKLNSLTHAQMLTRAGQVSLRRDGITETKEIELKH